MTPALKKKTLPTKPRAIAKAKKTKAQAPSKCAAKSKGGAKGDPDNVDAAIQSDIFKALAEVHAFKVAEVPSLFVAKFSGYNCVDSKPYRRNVKTMKDEGIISAPSTGTLSLTAAGAARSLVQPPKTNAEALARLQKIVEMFASGTKACDICQILSDGGARAKNNLAKQLGLSSTDTKSFRSAIAALRKLNFTDDLEDKNVQLADVAFPEGRPNASRGL